MRDDVTARLAAFGYTVTNADEWLLNWAIATVAQTIKNECNVSEVPDGLHYVAVDMACGEFLFAKRASGQDLNIDVETAIKSIKEGDTQITYAIPDGEAATFDGFIAALKRGDRSQFVTYRRFAW